MRVEPRPASSGAHRIRALPERPRALCLALFASVVLAGPAASAQTVILDTVGGEHRVGLSFGWDSVWNLELGYAYGLDDLVASQDFQLDAALVLPFLAMGEPNFKMTVGVSTVAPMVDAFRLGVALHTGFVLASDPTGEKLAIPLQLTLQPGWYPDGWLVALELAWRGALATYVWHSDVVRDLFEDRYPPGSPLAGSETGPSNGWYAFPANRLRVGVVAQVDVADHVSLFLTGGFDYTPDELGIIANPSIGHLPFYVTFGGSGSW